MKFTGIEKAIKFAGGTQTDLAKLLGIKPQSVQAWVATNKIPVNRVPEISKLTGIPKSELRPDFW